MSSTCVRGSATVAIARTHDGEPSSRLARTRSLHTTESVSRDRYAHTAASGCSNATEPSSPNDQSSAASRLAYSTSTSSQTAILGTRRSRPRPRREVQTPAKVAGADFAEFTGGGGPVEYVLAHRFQQSVPSCGVVELDEALVDEAGEDVQDAVRVEVFVSAHGFGGVEAEPTDERPESAQHCLFDVDRRRQCALARQRGPGPAGEHPEALVELDGETLDGQGAHPRCGQLEGQGDAIEALTDLGHRRSVGVGGDETTGRASAGPLDEQLRRPRNRDSCSADSTDGSSGLGHRSERDATTTISPVHSRAARPLVASIVHARGTAPSRLSPRPLGTDVASKCSQLSSTSSAGSAHAALQRAAPSTASCRPGASASPAAADDHRLADQRSASTTAVPARPTTRQSRPAGRPAPRPPASARNAPCPHPPAPVTVTRRPPLQCECDAPRPISRRSSHKGGS